MEISHDDQGPVRVITMSGPGGLNVFTLDVHEELGARLTEADGDDRVRVIILQGTDRSFSAGADIDSFPAAPCDPTTFVTEFLQANSLPERLRKPVLAVVRGSATAGGFELALACDWIFALPEARFSLPEARFGLVAGYAAARLTHIVGAHHARRLLMTGESLTADGAATLGLPVTVADDPLQAALGMADQICRGTPHAIRLIKQRTVALGRAFDPDFGISVAAYAQLWNLPDTREAITAWRENRPARQRPLNDPWQT
ncbi:enoyl-CoA hydratase/isomerase family protein [Actinomadura rugatobispora]|uniref:Enoyl-CoA hydratase/isomerase family protein n=1 Tax=Actinomadura rugatobispora TaxID=1994 RepID=A0ABW1AAB3_9ACTN|nr:enoyl-CoA hydratase-related protein [Actinomadura rugatobispora]